MQSVQRANFRLATQHGGEACVHEKKPLIAIVDDDEAVCRELEKLVCSEGMEADAFTSSQEFIALIEAMPLLHLDCVVLDIHMPKVNGLEVQERLSRLGKTLPVIFITAHDEREVREKAIAAGAVAFLRKPFDPELFIKTLNEAVRAQRSSECGRVGRSSSPS